MLKFSKNGVIVLFHKNNLSVLDFEQSEETIGSSVMRVFLICCPLWVLKK